MARYQACSLPLATRLKRYLFVHFKEGISTGVSEVNSDDVIGKLATSFAGLFAIFFVKVLVWSLGLCQWMLPLVLFSKLVSDWSRVFFRELGVAGHFKEF